MFAEKSVDFTKIQRYVLLQWVNSTSPNLLINPCVLS